MTGRRAFAVGAAAGAAGWLCLAVVGAAWWLRFGRAHRAPRVLYGYAVQGVRG